MRTKIRSDSRKHEVTIPEVICKALGLGSGKEVGADINVTRDGTITIKPMKKIPSPFGMLARVSYYRKNFKNNSPEAQRLLKKRIIYSPEDLERKKRITSMLRKSAKERKKVRSYVARLYKTMIPMSKVAKDLEISKEAVRENLTDMYNEGKIDYRKGNFYTKK